MSVKFIFAVAATTLSLSAGQVFAAAKGSDGPFQNQPGASSVSASAVGRWIYDSQGNIVGSVRNLTKDGRTAVIMVGSYFEPGSHEARVSTNELSIVNGRVILRTGTAEALNVADRR